MTNIKGPLTLLCLFGIVVSGSALVAAEPKTFDYHKQIAPIFTKFCNGCHNAEDAEGELVLESFASAVKGGENGAVIVPGKAAASRLILLLEHKQEPFMPPEDNKAPSAKQIALLKAWINAGAPGPGKDVIDPTKLTTEKIATRGKVRSPINALAFSPNGQWIAVARYRVVEILSARDRAPFKTLSGHTGHVNDVGFSADGKTLIVAAGEAGLVGEATLWNTGDWTRKRTLRGHRDTLYAAELSPNGKVLATGSYDQKIKIWDVSTGKELREMSGHNGAVTSLAFHTSGKILASASDDRTVKLWDVSTGKRLNTFNEPTKGQRAVAFSPDGRYVAAGGIDNRIRVWEVLQMGREGTNPLRYSRYAHLGPILNLGFSPDGRTLVSSSEDKTVKIWETNRFTQRRALADQSDWVRAIAISADSSTLLAGRLDGTLTSYSLDSELANDANRSLPLTQFQISKPLGSTSKIDRLTEIAEVEPNNLPIQATPLPTPGKASGVLQPSKTGTAPDADYFRFESKAGQTWIIETMAAREKSPADTKIEVTDADGKPIERMLLRAVRDSYVTFRPIDSNNSLVRVRNWEEMKMNQYMYMAGEVCKLFRAPRGPDSGWTFYSNGSKRRCYFDTSAIVHAKDEAVYIVEPFAPGSKLADNGLPVFALHFVNDDGGHRELGNDSKLTFTAPNDGSYLVRVTDVRNFGGADFKYKLIVRAPKPDFQVTIKGKNATVSAGSGRRISVDLKRLDGFNGGVRVAIEGLPDGFKVSSPIVVQAGHLSAKGVLNVSATVRPTPKPGDPIAALKPGASLPKPIDWTTVKVTASAVINGKEIVKNVGDLGIIKVEKKPKYVVTLNVDQPSGVKVTSSKPARLVMAPGTTITAMVRVDRNGFDGDLKFNVENLPHGVIVDNIGLSGVLVRAGETQRQIFLTAADWVPETSRQVHAVAISEGGQASPPIWLHIKKVGEIARIEQSGGSSN